LRLKCLDHAGRLLGGGAAAPVASGGARYTVCVGDAGADEDEAGNKMDRARLKEKRARSKKPPNVSSAGRASMWKPCRLVAPVPSSFTNPDNQGRRESHQTRSILVQFNVQKHAHHNSQ
jgi:hypothetical protein